MPVIRTAAPLTVQTSRFEAALPTRARPQRLASLGHDVAEAGPSGLVHHLATVVPVLTMPASGARAESHGVAPYPDLPLRADSRRKEERNVQRAVPWGRSGGSIAVPAPPVSLPATGPARTEPASGPPPSMAPVPVPSPTEPERLQTGTDNSPVYRSLPAVQAMAATERAAAPYPGADAALDLPRLALPVVAGLPRSEGRPERSQPESMPAAETPSLRPTASETPLLPPSSDELGAGLIGEATPLASTADAPAAHPSAATPLGAASQEHAPTASGLGDGAAALGMPVASPSANPTNPTTPSRRVQRLRLGEPLSEVPPFGPTQPTALPLVGAQPQPPDPGPPPPAGVAGGATLDRPARPTVGSADLFPAPSPSTPTPLVSREASGGGRRSGPGRPSNDLPVAAPPTRDPAPVAGPGFPAGDADPAPLAVGPNATSDHDHRDSPEPMTLTGSAPDPVAPLLGADPLEVGSSMASGGPIAPGPTPGEPTVVAPSPSSPAATAQRAFAASAPQEPMPPMPPRPSVSTPIPPSVPVPLDLLPRASRHPEMPAVQPSPAPVTAPLLGGSLAPPGATSRIGGAMPNRLGAGAVEAVQPATVAVRWSGQPVSAEPESGQPESAQPEWAQLASAPSRSATAEPGASLASTWSVPSNAVPLRARSGSPPSAAAPTQRFAASRAASPATPRPTPSPPASPARAPALPLVPPGQFAPPGNSWRPASVQTLPAAGPPEGAPAPILVQTLPGGWANPAAVQRDDTAAAPAAPAPLSPAPSAPPPAAGPSSASGAGPSGGSQGGDADLDDLSRKIYERIAARMRAELYLDRERAGLLTDLST
jgi:hypothetical protein